VVIGTDAIWLVPLRMETSPMRLHGLPEVYKYADRSRDMGTSDTG